MWTATAIPVAANLGAAAVMEIIAHARGTAIIPTAIFVTSALLPLLWVEDAERWLQGNPINAIIILMAAYWYASGRGRPVWPVYTVGFLLAAAQIATSLLN